MFDCLNDQLRRMGRREDAEGERFGALCVSKIESDDEGSASTFLLTNEKSRVIPEDMFYETLLVYVKEASDGERTEKEEFEAALSVTGLHDLEFVKFLGKGGFSQVLEVRLKETGRLYGLKTVRRDLI
jgi:hypothetical protein